MKKFSSGSWGKGIITFLAITVLLAGLFAIFGRNPYIADYDASGVRGKGEAGGQSTSAKAKAGYDMAAAEAPMPAPDVARPPVSPAGYALTGDDAGLNGSKYGLEATFSEEASVSLTEGRKIINEGNVSIETKDFDYSVTAVDQLIASSGGFAEMRNIQGTSLNSYNLRHATFVFRVPADKFDAVMGSMTGIGAVTQKNTSGTDITDRYVDLEARLKTLRVQEDTLLDLMAKAEKLEDVITLESRISEVRYEIESIQNSLKNYDRLIQYSRITLYLQEVVEVTEKKPVPRTLGDRISEAFNGAIEAFGDGLENFMIWIVANWILLAFCAFIILAFLAATAVYKGSKKKRIANLAIKNTEDASNTDDRQDT